MFGSLWAIITNTFTETLRQPVYGVVIAAAVLLLVFGPSLAMYTLDDDNQLLKDTGLSTLLVAGLFLAVFASSTVVTDEIENKTVLTVVTKTVSRTAFVIGKFIGIAAAVTLAEYFLSLVYLMVVRHGVLQTGSDRHDMVVIVLAVTAAAIVFLVGMAGNYFYHWQFCTTTVSLGAVLATVVVGILTFIDPQWKFNPDINNLHIELITPILLIFIAILILTAVAVASAMRLGLIMTMTICILTFVLGTALPPWLRAVQEQAIQNQSVITNYLSRAALAVVPSIDIFVVTNAIYKGATIPIIYLGQTALYALFYILAVLLFAIALFRSREIS